MEGQCKRQAGPQPGRRNHTVAKSPVIADGAGISVPDGTDILLVEGREPIADDKFHDEKISPVLTIYKAADFQDAYRILTELTSRVGRGHSCGIHTWRRDYIDYLGTHMKTSRVTVRQPMSAGNGGHPFNRMPSTATLGCGTWGGNITTENVHWKQFINVTWVNEPVSPCGLHGRGNVGANSGRSTANKPAHAGLDFLKKAVMNLFEYQAKEAFRECGMTTPRVLVVRGKNWTRLLLKRVFPCVLKSQVLRGRAHARPEG